MAGAGFAETCAELFVDDPDVGELAALEWAMGQAFSVADVSPMTMDAFARETAAFAEADWAMLRLRLVPGLAVLAASYDLVQLWPTLAPDHEPAEPTLLERPQAAVVWREDESPVFVLREQWEGEALAAILRGETFGDACAIVVNALGEEQGANEAGAMLARWFGDGLVAGIAQ